MTKTITDIDTQNPTAIEQLSERYCSWCLIKTDHKLHQKYRNPRRDVYQCQACENYTLPCTFCDNMAKGALKSDIDHFWQWDNFRCAEHDGSVKNFEREEILLEDITDFSKLLLQRKSNYSLSEKVGRYFAEAYFKEDECFNIVKLPTTTRSPQNHPLQKVILINGFLKSQDELFQDWLTAYQEIPNHYELYGLIWSSQSPEDFIKHFIPSSPSSFLSRKLLLAKLVHTMVTNPWHVSMKKAQDTGELLGNILHHTDGPTYTLVGHSLGCRVIYYALDFLRFFPEKRVHNIILLGGAMGNQAQDWEAVTQSITGKIYNCYSRHDEMLHKGYNIATLKMSAPIGYYPIASEHEKIINLDFSDIINSHHDWKAQYSKVYQRLKAVLKSTSN